MSEIKHTPGPWAIEDSRDDFEVYPVKDGPPKLGRWAEVATVSGIYEKEAAANARLIAAAPELLAALKLVMTWVKNWDPTFTEDEEWYEQDAIKIDAAIAKAEGRGDV